MSQSDRQEPQDTDESKAKPSKDDADQAAKEHATEAEAGQEGAEEGGEEGAAEEEAPREPLTRVECPAAKGYDNPATRLLIVAIVAVGIGVYCAYDAYIARLYEQVPMTWENASKWASYAFNAYGPFILIPLGVFLGVWAIRRLQQVLVADEEGIGYVGREKIAWSEITELDGKRVEKGLLTLTYGQDGELVLDSWKLKNFRDLVAIIEQHVPEDKQVK
ncbi:MAG: hypothetical protein ACE15C_15975 [Phycisphaerae bacterium]